MAELYHKSNSKDGVIILHGGSAGVESSFVQTIFKKAIDANLSALAYDFPYIVRGEKELSADFTEEIKTVQLAIERMREQGIINPHIIAKSVGSAVLAKTLQNNPDLTIDRITIMGLPLGLIDLEPLTDRKLRVIQGEFDRFGDAKLVAQTLSKADVHADVIQIPGATHSFRDKETDSQPIFEDAAIEQIIF